MLTKTDMAEQHAPSKKSRPNRERRRFPRYPWTLPTRVRTSHQIVSQGTLLNMGRGGVMLETKEILSPGAPLWLRVGKGEEEQSKGIVLLGRTVWGMPSSGGDNRYGVAFLEGQVESYERLYQYLEVAHSRGVAKTFGLRFVHLTPSMVEKRALRYVDRDLAFSLNCVPVKLRGERLMVAMARPGDSRALEKLRLFSQCKILPVVATPSAIRNALIPAWGVQYVPSGVDMPPGPHYRQLRQVRKPRIITLVSSIPDISGKFLAANLVAVLNRDETRALLIDLDSDSSPLLNGVPAATDEQYEWMFLALSMDPSVSSLDWTVRADEMLLVVSPSHWQKGYFYIEAVFNWFVDLEKHHTAAFSDGIAGQRVLELSVVCAQISNVREGFKIFRRIETRVHHELDMRELGFDIRLHYNGGILDDGSNIRKAEKMGVPLTTLKPHSPASQCLTHIAHSLQRPAHARDPRINVNWSLVSRIFG